MSQRNQRNIFLAWMTVVMMVVSAALSGCAATSEEPAENPAEPAAQAERAAAPAAAAPLEESAKRAERAESVKGGEPPAPGDPSTMACSSWTNIACNLNSGGTAYCRQVLQEQSAWCARPQPGYTAVCCYP